MQYRLNIYIYKTTCNSIIAFFLFCFGGAIASFLYTKNGYTFFYQNFIPESILWACGYDFAFPKKIINELIPFLKGHQTTFDCGDLKDLNFFTTPGNYYLIHPYLAWSTAILWKWIGVNYHALTPLIFTLWGAYVSGIFLLFRQFFNKLISVGAALFICLSPITAHMLFNLRDFSKGPFIIWSIYLLIISIQEPSKTGFKSIIPLVLAGGIAGIGMGFRSDLFFLLPIGSIFLFLGSSTSLVNNWPSKILARAKQALIFSIAFIVFAFPILKTAPPSGAGGVFIIQGMSEPFRIALGLKEAGYTTGFAYSDELTLSAIASNERIKNTKWDSNEIMGIPGISISDSIKLGTFNFSKWGNLFIGDLTNQAIKSSLWIIAFPIFVSNTKNLIATPEELTIQSLIYHVYHKAHSPIILIFLLLGFIFFLFQSYKTSISKCVAMAFLFIFLISYPGLQFNLRHFFYLEFIWIIFFIYLISSTHNIIYNRKKFIKFILTVLGIVIVAILLYLTIIQYQKWVLSKTVNELLNLPREQIYLKSRVFQKGKVFMPVDTPSEFQNLIKSKFDSMTPAMEFIGSQWDVRSGAARYLLTVSGNNCNSTDIEVYLSYKSSLATWQSLDTVLLVPQHSDSKVISLLFSAYYRPNQYFNGLLVSDKFSKCNFKLEKIIGYNQLPFIFTAKVEQSKIYGPIIKRIGNFNIR